MIRVKLGRKIDGKGVFEYSIPSLAYASKSRQPLLDACRQILSMGGSTGEQAGLFREGRSSPDLACGVGWGVRRTVKEPDKGSIHFAKYEPFKGG